jgi:hypothetical protein
MDVGCMMWMTSWLYLLYMAATLCKLDYSYHAGYILRINLAAMVAKENNDYLEGFVQSRKNSLLGGNGRLAASKKWSFLEGL